VFPLEIQNETLCLILNVLSVFSISLKFGMALALQVDGGELKLL